MVSDNFFYTLGVCSLLINLGTGAFHSRNRQIRDDSYHIERLSPEPDMLELPDFIHDLIVSSDTKTNHPAIEPTHINVENYPFDEYYGEVSKPDKFYTFKEIGGPTKEVEESGSNLANSTDSIPSLFPVLYFKCISDLIQNIMGRFDSVASEQKDKEILNVSTNLNNEQKLLRFPMEKDLEKINVTLNINLKPVNEKGITQKVFKRDISKREAGPNVESSNSSTASTVPHNIQNLDISKVDTATTSGESKDASTSSSSTLTSNSKDNTESSFRSLIDSKTQTHINSLPVKTEDETVKVSPTSGTETQHKTETLKISSNAITETLHPKSEIITQNSMAAKLILADKDEEVASKTVKKTVVETNKPQTTATGMLQNSKPLVVLQNQTDKAFLKDFRSEKSQKFELRLPEESPSSEIAQPSVADFKHNEKFKANSMFLTAGLISFAVMFVFAAFGIASLIKKRNVQEQTGHHETTPRTANV